MVDVTRPATCGVGRPDARPGVAFVRLTRLAMTRLECVLCSLRQAACLGRCLRCCKHHASMKALEGQRICPPAANWGGGQLRVPGPPTCVRGRRKLKLRRAWAGTTLLVAAAAARAFAKLGPSTLGSFWALLCPGSGPGSLHWGVVAPLACWMYRSIQKRSKTADHMRAGVC